MGACAKLSYVREGSAHRVSCRKSLSGVSEERRELAPQHQEVHGEFGAAIETDDLVQIAMKKEGEQVPERGERGWVRGIKRRASAG